MQSIEIFGCDFNDEGFDFEKITTRKMDDDDVDDNDTNNNYDDNEDTFLKNDIDANENDYDQKGTKRGRRPHVLDQVNMSKRKLQRSLSHLKSQILNSKGSENNDDSNESISNEILDIIKKMGVLRDASGKMTIRTGAY